MKKTTAERSPERRLAQLTTDGPGQQPFQGENLRLRREVARLEEQLATLRRENRREQEAYDFLERQLNDIEGENRRISQQFLEFGLQNAYLASLYAASSCLHETEERQEVLEVIGEIVFHFIGSQEVAVFELDPTGTALELAYAHGLEPGAPESIPVGEGLLGTVASTGEPYIAGLCDASRQRPEEAMVSAGIPLKIGDRVAGVIAVFRLLPEKDGAFDQLDHKLFDLLARQAGTSLARTALGAGMDVGRYLH